MKLYVSILMLLIKLDAVSSAVLFPREGRLIGGAGYNDTIEVYDCPCGCNITSVQGEDDKQFVPPDPRCYEKDTVPVSRLLGHYVDCPCGCTVTFSSNTTVIVSENKNCAKSGLSKIDDVHLLCPCSCYGITSNKTNYSIPRTSKCPIPIDSRDFQQNINAERNSQQRNLVFDNRINNNDNDNNEEVSTKSTGDKKANLVLQEEEIKQVAATKTSTTTRMIAKKNDTALNLINRSSMPLRHTGNIKYITTKVFKSTTRFPGINRNTNRSNNFNRTFNRFDINNKTKPIKSSMQNVNELKKSAIKDRNAKQINENVNATQKRFSPKTRITSVQDKIKDVSNNLMDKSRFNSKTIQVKNDATIDQNNIEQKEHEEKIKVVSAEKQKAMTLSLQNIENNEVSFNKAINLETIKSQETPQLLFENKESNEFVFNSNNKLNNLQNLDETFVKNNDSPFRFLNGNEITNTVKNTFSTTSSSDDVEAVPVIIANQDIKSEKSLEIETDLGERLVIHPSGPIRPNDVLTRVLIK